MKKIKYMIAIHHRPGNFSERWITYCNKKGIPYKLVNCYDSDIIKQLENCDALMWHHSHIYYKDVLFAKQLLYSLKQAGIKVFPNFNTNWHFDDKIGQKYLLEAIDAPLVPSYVFYDKKTAIEWAFNTTYPKVFKLRGGAGSQNVSLIKNKKEALRIINGAFGKGFSQYNRLENFKEKYRRYRIGKETLWGVMKGIARLFIATEFAKMNNRDKGYVYFQEFIPENNYDTRIIIVGDKAFGITRGVRENDFRASGSGNITYDKEKINIEMVKIAFDVNRKINSQSIAYDFILDGDKPLIVEISYGYAIEAYDPCPGYWDTSLSWHEGQFNPQEWMIENLINELKINV
ncbi:hypothetical protein SDC9_87638 [bioreactor metagenome]|uniref:ATP-grasp fold RimK-type domain-containing protein n=1 Tax=bioreactor metagenome TaxID=1076179 RepID=A0A644ZJH1_9ZZZZ